jgi:hypothetical protein
MTVRISPVTVPISRVTEPVPVVTESVPVVTEPVPVVTEPVPVVTEPVPARKVLQLVDSMLICLYYFIFALIKPIKIGCLEAQ